MGVKAEGRVVQELGVLVELGSRQQHQQALETVQISLRRLVADPELFANFVVEIFEQLLAGSAHRLVNFEGEFQLQLVKRRLNLFRPAAVLVNAGNPFFEVDARLDGAEDLVAGTKHALEELKFLAQKLVDALIGLVFLIEEVHHDNVMALPVTMTAANPLFDALGVPGEVVIHYQRAELQVDALGTGFRRDHDPSLLTEVIDERRAHVSRSGTRDPIRVPVSIQPLRVNLP